MEREGSYRLEASVEESRLGTVHAGQNVSVVIEGCRAPQRVSEIVPAVDAASRSYMVKVELPIARRCAPACSDGSNSRVGSRQVIAVPASAVTDRGQLQLGVRRRERRRPQPPGHRGAEIGDAVEVLSGLSAGEQVVAPVPLGLQDGARVEVGA